jgi:hypothetical protein
MSIFRGACVALAMRSLAATSRQSFRKPFVAMWRAQLARQRLVPRVNGRALRVLAGRSLGFPSAGVQPATGHALKPHRSTILQFRRRVRAATTPASASSLSGLLNALPMAVCIADFMGTG